MGGARVNMLIINSNITNQIKYVIAQWKTPKNDSATDQFDYQAPQIAKDFDICRKIQGPTVAGTFESTRTTFSPIVIEKPNTNCDNGRGNREGIVVMAVLLFIHACILLIFCAVTCKIESLKEKIWDVDI